MKTIVQHALFVSVIACLLFAGAANALELTVHEDSAVRLDFTVSWSDPGDENTIYRRGGPAPGGWPPYDSFIEVEEHLPLVAVVVLSKYFPWFNDAGDLDYDGFILDCVWTYPEAHRGPGVPGTGPGAVPATDPAWDRTLVYISSNAPWHRISPDGQSGRFVYGTPPVPDGGSTLLLGTLGLAGVGLLRRVRV